MQAAYDNYLHSGYDREFLETNSCFLAALTASAATEIDNYILGRSRDFTNVHDFADLLKKYIVRRDGLPVVLAFPYTALLKGMSFGSSKGSLSTFPGLGLEMRLLEADLRSVNTLKEERLQELRKELCEISRHFLSNGNFPHV